MQISPLIENPKLRVLSLGAGVQSTVMALMAAKGEFGPMPDICIFADTQWEPKGVYEHLTWLNSVLPFPIDVVTAGNIRDDTLAQKNTTGQKRRGAAIPLFVEGGGMGMRQCTKEYKIQPITQKVRSLLGLKKGQRGPRDAVVEQWIGISTDEIVRAKESRFSYIRHRFPLIEKRMSRQDCLKWFEENYPGKKLAKSACIGCPFHDDRAWREMKQNDPDSWADAVDFDYKIRDGGALGRMRNKQYVHRSLMPLDQVDLRTAEDFGQLSFLDECDGMCGV